MCGRREFLGGLGALVAPSFAVSCQPASRSEVLRGLASEVLCEMARTTLAASRSLELAARRLDVEPSPARVHAAKLAFASAARAWKRQSAFRSGPLIESKALSAALFWPADTAAIDALLTEPHLLDEARASALNLDERGLFAVEYLLFARTPSELASERGRQARAYARQAANNVAGYALRVSRLLGDGTALGARLASDGPSSVNLLAAQMLDSVSMLRGKFERVGRARKLGASLVSAVEGYFSGLSLEIARALLDGTRQLYVGGPSGGVSALVRQASPAIDAHVLEGFATVAVAFSAQSVPLEQALIQAPEAFQSALGSLQALEHTLQVEASSALGV